MIKRIVSIVLVLLMLLPCIVACKKDPDVQETEPGESVVPTTPSVGKYDVQDDLGDLDYGGRTITIANVGRSWYDEDVAVERLNGSIVNDAVYKRNLAVEKRLNIKIKNVRYTDGAQNAVIKDLTNAVQTGDLSYDIIHNPTYTIGSHVSKNLFYNLRKIDSLNLDGKPYWSTYVNEATSIGEGQYAASGAVSLSFYRFIWVTVVNNNVLDNAIDSPDIVSVVKDGKWTLEYQKGLVTKFYDDNGVAGKDEEDNFGLVTSDFLNVDPYLSSCEMTLLEKGEDGYYSFALDVERMSNVLTIVLDMFKSDGTYCYRLDSKHETGNGEQISIAKKFASGSTLMASLRINEIENAAIRDMKDEYTIIPIPKYSEDQEKYYSYTHDSFASMALPSIITAEDAEIFGSVMEAMASESYRTVTPAYYETALKTRYTDNEVSWEMLDMITQNVKMDAMTVFSKSLSVGKSCHSIYRGIVNNSYRKGTSINVASSFAAYSEGVDAKLNGPDGLNTILKELQAIQ